MSAKVMEIFFSYSHKDEVLRDELAIHLRILEREGLIRPWYDREITAGQDWAEKIDAHLESADIVLLLVSPDFVASDYCWGLEMKRALERHEARTAQVIPIILRPVDWRSAPFAKLQALPRNAKPITTWANPDAQLRNEFVLANPELEYEYPLVGKKLRGDRRKQLKHRDVVSWIWGQIRAAKHTWNGKDPFIVRVGDTTSVMGSVTFDEFVGEPLSTEPPVASKPAVWQQGSSILLSLPPDLIQHDARMLEFAEFVTGTVVEEALLHAGVEESEIDTFLISGRGALWPVVHERLMNRFGRVRKDLIRDRISMKQVVAQGAIAFQGLLFKAGEYKWSDKPASSRSTLRSEDAAAPFLRRSQ